jgi:hypothetical protein
MVSFGRGGGDGGLGERWDGGIALR